MAVQLICAFVFQGCNSSRFFDIAHLMSNGTETQVHCKINVDHFLMEDLRFKFCNDLNFRTEWVWANSEDPDQTATRGAV